jgi:GTPase SAR1 family protein
MKNFSGSKAEPKNPCKIGILGAKEVGKTSLANLLTGRLKSLGISADLVHETARRAPWKLNKKTSIEAAYWLLGSQIASESLVQATRQFTICDRTVLDTYPFLAFSFQEGRISPNPSHEELKLIKSVIRDYIKARPYDYLILVPIRQELWVYYSEPSDKELQVEIDKAFRNFLKELSLEYHELHTLNSIDRVEEVMKLLRERYHFSLEGTDTKFPV